MRRSTLLGLASLLTLAACGAGPDYARPETPSSAAAPFIGARSEAVTAEAPADNWWQLYQDPVLDRLVADALAANKDLAVAAANLARTRALLQESRAGRLPQTTIGAGGSYGRLPAGQRSAGADREAWSIDAGLDISYEVDLFGRIGRSIEAARGDAEADAAALDVARVAVAAETARAYADASSSAERLAVAERTVELLDQTVTLTSKRFEAGRTTRLDVSRAAALRDQQRATLSPLRADRDAALFRLATLTGRPPADLPPEVGQRATTLKLDRPIPVGDGRALLARRPDVREAERRLAAETARIGVATADLYPRITLGGSIGSTGPSIGDMFGGGPLRWLLGSLLSWSFPNQEANRARIAAAEATTQAALARFDGTVLRALEETETALSRYAHELDRRQALTSARDEARTAATISRAQLREGRADFLVVLDAERTLANAEADLAESDARVVTTQVDLFRALGGGWQNGAIQLDAYR
ncbi:efflux transporter outer membrane subunit [Rhizorhapis suberifaciens]|uniref:NodT family efflux transporter outer membrane factor (OMF) lipoprotein n=1 Tax=Rhizorhapis suberifaciens TaxID=13656 RepID=A0A840HZE2_9SPHN|nr:TolC family protein [Rhizorhapis suberifaciens]MBB4643021.1 NodT family efflux transporter outer membrane factor (OMF) lipoprotein [Rhizorhapis suberifaciens]